MSDDDDPTLPPPPLPPRCAHRLRPVDLGLSHIALSCDSCGAGPGAEEGQRFFICAHCSAIYCARCVILGFIARELV